MSQREERERRKRKSYLNPRIWTYFPTKKEKIGTWKEESVKSPGYGATRGKLKREKSCGKPKIWSHQPTKSLRFIWLLSLLFFLFSPVAWSFTPRINYHFLLTLQKSKKWGKTVLFSHWQTRAGIVPFDHRVSSNFVCPKI